MEAISSRPPNQVRNAIASLRASDQCRLIAVSGLYQSPPHCGREQPDYINAVAAVLTTLEPVPLLRYLLSLETRHGRTRSGEKWEPRVLDLDLLAYSSVQLETEELTLPHAGIPERNFVLFPWRDITPWYVVPGLSSVSKLAAQIKGSAKPITKLE